MSPPFPKRDEPPRLPAALFLILIASAASPGCGPDGLRLPGRDAGPGNGFRAAALRRDLDARAARARDRLEAARADAEAALARRTHDRSIDFPLARDRARRALEEGTAVLDAAARDGGEAAAGWARVIQERMMRLQRSIREPDDADGRAANS